MGRSHIMYCILGLLRTTCVDAKRQAGRNRTLYPYITPLTHEHEKEIFYTCEDIVNIVTKSIFLSSIAIELQSFFILSQIRNPTICGMKTRSHMAICAICTQGRIFQLNFSGIVFQNHEFHATKLVTVVIMQLGVQPYS
jgi:hypothetical protein